MVPAIARHVRGRIMDHLVVGPTVFFQNLGEPLGGTNTDTLVGMAFSEAGLVIGRQLGQLKTNLAIRVQYRTAEQAIRLFDPSRSIPICP